jgi:hypothetical protein
MDDLGVLQALRLKGRAPESDVASTLNADPGEVHAAIEQLVRAGLVTPGPMLALSPDGRGRLRDLLADERSSVDASAMAATYAQFRSVNADFKALITDWQLRDGRPNDHTDPCYDDAVLARLGPVHNTVMRIVAAAAAQVPRLANYGAKLTTAWERVRAGDLAWLVRPLADSYHTVWFELHEELIGVAGLSRQDEARAGYAD